MTLNKYSHVIGSSCLYSDTTAQLNGGFMRIAVMGTGGVGGYFGARLAKAGMT